MGKVKAILVALISTVMLLVLMGAATGTPDKISFFYGDSGVALPAGVDAANNPFINVAEKKANVTLTVEVPGYQDFETKFKLLMASGKLPDVVHTWWLDIATKAGEEGAFIDLKPYYDKSPALQKVISKEMMKLAESPSGKNFRIPMAWDKAPQGSALMVREDMLDKYNGGKYPTTIQGYVDLLYKIKKANPKSIPMSNRVQGDVGLSYGGNTLYCLVGACPRGDRIEGDVVKKNFVTPEYRYITEIMRKLYKDGILDKEFSTNTSDKWSARWMGNTDTFFQFDGSDQLAGYSAIAITGHTGLPKTNRYIFAPPLASLPAVVKDVRQAQAYKSKPITSHGVYISSSSKNKDAAWRFIEALASDEFYNALWYGFEGQTYKVVNGKKVPDFAKLADPAISYKLHLNFIFGFVTGQEVSVAQKMSILGPAYGKRVFDSIIPYDAQAKKNGIHPLNFVEPEVSIATKTKYAEIDQFVTKASFEAIMGRITMAQFDKKVAEFTKKYAAVYAEKTAVYKKIKPTLKAKGVNVLDL